MAEQSGDGSPSTWQIIAAFAAVYLIWGSTYLAILFAIETLPPFLMAGVRFLIAGGILYGWTRLRGGERPERAHWVSTAIVGAFLLLGGNGAVVWAELRVSSGMTALIVATVPLWMVLADWLRPGGVRPTGRVALGLLVGFAGLIYLVGPGETGADAVDGLGAAVLLLGSLLWAIGSIYARGAPRPKSPLLGTGMEMLAGGALLVVVGLAAGEATQVDLSTVSTQSIIALAYLIVFGSLIGYSAYVWLLHVTTPARVSTYAYVNPVVAVFLGWALAGEVLNARTILATVVIVGSVVIITWPRRSRRGHAARTPAPSRGASPGRR